MGVAEGVDLLKLGEEGLYFDERGAPVLKIIAARQAARAEEVSP